MQPNPYNHLRIECHDDVAPVEATSLWPVSAGKAEQITITSALLSEGLWVYGYVVHWARGGISAKDPIAEHGKFRTQREAKLHAVGFMKAYLPHFLPDTQADILAAERSLQQDSLF